MSARVPPHSPEAERSLVGTLLAQPDALGDVLARGIAPGDFYAPRWGAAFAAILALASRGEAIDTVAAGSELATGAYGDAVPDLADLTAEVRDVPSLAHAETYAGRVVDDARLRRVIAACAEITEAAYGPDARADVDTFGDRAEVLLHAATERPGFGAGPAELGQVLDAAIVELRSRSAGERVGVPTGFVDLDRLTGGFRPGQLVVVGARPSMGKSALALDVALHVAREVGPVLFVSAEMGALELGSRVLAGGGVASDRLLAERLDDRAQGVDREPRRFEVGRPLPKVERRQLEQAVAVIGDDVLDRRGGQLALDLVQLGPHGLLVLGPEPAGRGGRARGALDRGGAGGRARGPGRARLARPRDPMLTPGCPEAAHGCYPTGN